MLNIENLRVDLDTDDAVIRAVDAMWQSIERGETFALVGESGSHGRGAVCRRMIAGGSAT